MKQSGVNLTSRRKTKTGKMSREKKPEEKQSITVRQRHRQQTQQTNDTKNKTHHSPTGGKSDGSPLVRKYMRSDIKGDRLSLLDPCDRIAITVFE